MGMTREEFLVIAKGIRSVYGKDKVIPDQDVFNVWYELLKDMDYHTASDAAQAYMMTEHFPPAPADIRKKALTLAGIPTELSEGEAWDLVMRAIGKSGYSYEEEYAKLPRDIQKAVGSARQLHIWAVDEDFNGSVIQSQFLRSYRLVKDRQQSIKILPQRMQDLLAKTTERMIEGR